MERLDTGEGAGSHAAAPDRARAAAQHPIQVVARRTGLSADVIRAWERRYAAVAPTRTRGRRRLYSDADVARLTLLRELTESGRRIGDIAGLDSERLAALAEPDRGAPRERASEPVPGAPAPAGEHVEACLRAIERFDSAALERALATASLELCVPSLLDEVLTPLMRRIGSAWRDGPLRVAHEHLATASLRTFLGDMLGVDGREDGPCIVLATPCRQAHELGTLMAAIVARNAGWRTVFLGAEVPAEEVAYAARACGARAVALGLCYPADDARLPGELRRLRARLPEGVDLMVGGGCHAGYAEIVGEIGAHVVTGLRALHDRLDALRESQSEAR